MRIYTDKTRLCKVFFSFLLLLNCSGCPNGESGKLMPQKAENIKLVKTEKADDTAQIEKDGKIFLISGSWGSQGLQRLQIIITNNADTEFQFDLQKIKLELMAQESLVLIQAMDDTNVNSADENPNNDDPIILYPRTNSGTYTNTNKSSKISDIPVFTVLQKETKSLTFHFANSQIKGNQLHAGNQVYVTVPTGEYPADSIKILFNCAENEFFTF